MPPAPVAVPNVLTDPGYLFIAPLASAEPAHTVSGGVFTDAWPAAWLPLGATEAGSTFSYSTNVEAITVAEFFDPIKYATTERSGNIAFNLANWTLSNYRRALNGGIPALTGTQQTAGDATTTLTELEPPDPGGEVRAMIGWESLDNTLRLMLRQTIQGGEVSSAFQKAPALALIPCTFNMEVPTNGTKPWKLVGAGTKRV
jgi:hypothetical protein